MGSFDLLGTRHKKVNICYITDIRKLQLATYILIFTSQPVSNFLFYKGKTFRVNNKARNHMVKFNYRHNTKGVLTFCLLFCLFPFQFKWSTSAIKTCLSLFDIYVSHLIKFKFQYHNMCLTPSPPPIDEFFISLLQALGHHVRLLI